MIQTDDILKVLRTIIHPESGRNLIDLEMVDHLNVSEEKISLTLCFARPRDPLAASLKRNVETAILTAYPEYEGRLAVFIKEAAPKHKSQNTESKRSTSSLAGVKNIIAVSSAKGGVGKSTVAANLAVALTRMNYRVGILDADLYGPSQPTLFGLEDYEPAGVQIDGEDRILPAEAFGIKIMSIGFFINPSDALIWRGPMATNALKQLIQQTQWGELDFLLIDLPPGTGDIHLTLVTELPFTGAVIVSTPQKMALADVVRGIQMFKNDKIHIPLLGLIENMSWFTPAELPDHRYYIFGQGGARTLAAREGIKLLGEIPLIQSVREASDEGKPLTEEENMAASYYEDIAGNLVHQLNKVVSPAQKGE